MSKNETTTIHTTLAGGQGMTFVEKGLENETHMEKEKKTQTH